VVAFTDLPKLACVRITAVSTVKSGRGILNKYENAKLNSAAIVTLRENPSWALCSQACARSDSHRVAMRVMIRSPSPNLQRRP